MKKQLILLMITAAWVFFAPITVHAQEEEIEVTTGAAVEAEPEIAAEETEQAEPAPEEDEAKTEDSGEKVSRSLSVKAKTKEKKKNYTLQDVKLLACLIYAEAGNQPYEGKLAVANVVVNRMKSELFPDTLKEVIYQTHFSQAYRRTIYQFSVASPSVGTLKKALSLYKDRTIESEIKAERECIEAAKAALSGESAFEKGEDYLYFCRYTRSLAQREPEGMRLEAHYFY